MAWVRFEDKRWCDDRLREAGPVARALDEAAIEYCADRLTDGELTLNDLRVIAEAIGMRYPTRTAAVLVKVGRWERHASSQDGWSIRHYLDYQPSKDQVIEKRERMRKLAALGGRKAQRLAHGRAQRSSDTVERDAQAPRSSATVERAMSTPKPIHTEKSLDSDFPVWERDARCADTPPPTPAAPPAAAQGRPPPPPASTASTEPAATESAPGVRDAPPPGYARCPRCEGSAWLDHPDGKNGVIQCWQCGGKRFIPESAIDSVAAQLRMSLDASAEQPIDVEYRPAPSPPPEPAGVWPLAGEQKALRERKAPPPVQLPPVLPAPRPEDEPL